MDSRMTMKGFIDNLSREIKQDLKLHPIKEDNILIKLESAVSYDEFTRLFTGLFKKYENSINLVSHENLQCFCDFLSARWSMIQNTDAIYPHSPHSLINRVCSVLAKNLGAILKQEYLKLLMPNVKFTNYNLTFTEFIIRDDGENILKVIDGFDHLHFSLSDPAAAQADKMGRQYLQSRRNSSPQHSSKLAAHESLTGLETRRIIAHSENAHTYYDQIYSARNLTQLDEFVSALKSDDYKVTASYSTIGEVNLLLGMLRKINRRQDFASFLTKYLPKDEWLYFLDSKLIALCEDELFRIMLEIDESQLEAHKPLTAIAELKLQDILKSNLITKNCDLLVLSAFDPQQDVKNIPCKSPTAFILVRDQFYYLDKTLPKLTHIELDAPRLSKLKELLSVPSLKSSDNYHCCYEVMSLAQLEVIANITKQPLFTYRSAQLRALFICLLKIYKKTRNEGDEYSSRFGYVGGLLWGSSTYSKKVKLSACEALISLLVNDDIPLEQIRSTELYKLHQGPLGAATLGLFSKLLSYLEINKQPKLEATKSEMNLTLRAQP